MVGISFVSMVTNDFPAGRTLLNLWNVRVITCLPTASLSVSLPVTVGEYDCNKNGKLNTLHYYGNYDNRKLKCKGSDWRVASNTNLNDIVLVVTCNRVMNGAQISKSLNNWHELARWQLSFRSDKLTGVGNHGLIIYLNNYYKQQRSVIRCSMHFQPQWKSLKWNK